MAHENLVRAVLSNPATWTFNKAAAPYRVPPQEGIVLLIDSEQHLQKAEYIAYTGLTDNGSSFTLTGVERAQEGSAQETWTAGAILLQTSLASLMNKLDGLNASVTPAADKLPRADAQGKIDPDWLTYELPAILQAKAVTAVDLFVYDTSHDSDGGAWRVNGDLPAVSVISAEASLLTIYSADNQALPVFAAHDFTGYTIKSIAAANGKIAVGTTAGIVVLDYTTATTAVSIDYSIATAPAIISNAVNDVAMTVLPNAPVDPSTSLQIPTIAVATNGGVSVIKDDGTVVDITHATHSNITFTDFIGNGDLVYVAGTSTGLYTHVVDGVPDADLSADVGYQKTSIDRAFYPCYVLPSSGAAFGTWYPGNAQDAHITALSGINTGLNKGLSVISENDAEPSNGLRAKVTSSYNTGWMHGDCKLAALCDTETGSISAPNLVTDGTFDDGSGWTNETNWVVGSGTLNATGADGTRSYRPLDTPVNNSKVYKVTYEVSNYVSGSARILVYGQGVVGVGANRSANGTYTEYLNLVTASSSFIDTVVVQATISPFTGSIDNVSVKEVTPDRSGNNNHIDIIGTLNRTPIGNGEIAAWSGFSATDYLEMPYTPDLDFGTGDFYINIWVDLVGADLRVARYYYNGSALSGAYLGVIANTSGVYSLISDGASSQSTAPVSGSIAGTGSRCITTVMRSKTLEVYLDSELCSTVDTSSIGSIDNTLASLKIGAVPGFSSVVTNGSICLTRVGKGAPSANQIRKMYEDELAMIQGKATLYGTSDVVRALAHDPVTDLLHAGTDDGRSIFKDLTNVDHTTDPVTSSISAVNGFVMEG